MSTNLEKIVKQIVDDFSSSPKRGEEEMYRMIHLQLSLFPNHEVSQLTSDGVFWLGVLERSGLSSLSSSFIEEMNDREVDQIYEALCGCRPIAIQNVRETIATMMERERESGEECNLFLLYKAIHRHTVVDSREDIFSAYHSLRCLNLCQKKKEEGEGFCSKECRRDYTNLIKYA
jgi:hypothetical protein